MRPLVSVVVPTRNRPELLGRALASIAGQHLESSEFEVVVVNDGGTDVGTPVREAAERGLSVRTVEFRSRHGLPEARNAGIAKSRGEYTAFLDDDDIFLPSHLSCALEALEDGFDGVYTTCLVSADRAEPFAAVDPVESYNYDYCRDLLSVCNYIAVHSLVLRGLKRTGALFDPSLPAGEDWDMWLRLTRKHGYQLRHVPVATAVYHKIPSQSSMTGSTSTDAAAHDRFAEVHRIVWNRWPAPSQKAERFRRHVSLMDQMAHNRLSAATTVPHLYYELTLRLLVNAWNMTVDEASLPGLIADELGGDVGFTGTPISERVSE